MTSSPDRGDNLIEGRRCTILHTHANVLGGRVWVEAEARTIAPGLLADGDFADPGSDQILAAIERARTDKRIAVIQIQTVAAVVLAATGRLLTPEILAEADHRDDEVVITMGFSDGEVVKISIKDTHPEGISCADPQGREVDCLGP
jgi:hypothetical protein